MQSSSISSKHEQNSVSNNRKASTKSPSRSPRIPNSSVSNQQAANYRSESRFQYSNYSVDAINQAEEAAKIEKFKRITETNPVNLGKSGFKSLG